MELSAVITKDGRSNDKVFFGLMWQQIFCPFKEHGFSIKLQWSPADSDSPETIVT
jgi:hypothetical protein